MSHPLRTVAPMCGRIAAYTPPNKVALALDAGIRVRAEPEPEWRPSYNVPPARRILAVRIDKEGARSLGQFGWGLIPHWAKDPKIGSRAFNARADTVAQKPMFRSAFRSKRCLVPVDGFYEWKREGADKRPYFFTRADENLTVFAGIWEFWEREGHGLWTCSIITTDASPDMEDVHNRMPVILERESWTEWLSPVNQATELTELLVPARGRTLEMRPVDRAVGSVRNDRPELLAKLKQRVGGNESS